LVRTRLSLSEGLNEGVKYKGILHCGKHTIKSEGITGLYKGITPSILSGTPYVGLQMTFYDLFKRNFPKDKEGYTSPFWSLMAGSCSGLTAQTITYPGDTVRRRMQTDGIGGSQKHYKNTFDCFKVMITKEGLGSLMHGYRANVVKCIPGSAIQFAIFDAFKKYFGIEVH